MSAYNTDHEQSSFRRQGFGAVLWVGLAVVLLYLPPPRQQEVATLVRSTVLRPFIATQELMAGARRETLEAEELQRRMDSLVGATTNLNALAEENRRLRELLDLQRRLEVDYRAASLLRPGTQGSESIFLLDVEDGADVRPGAPVIAPEGLVGVVREVGPGGAVGLDWTHPDFRASAMTRDGTTYGIVEPRRGDFREVDRLALTGTPFTTRLEPGTLLVTSGRGGVYPRGIPIGTVGELAEAEGGWRKTYWVTPAVDLGTATHVLVAVGASPASPRNTPVAGARDDAVPSTEEPVQPPSGNGSSAPADRGAEESEAWTIPPASPDTTSEEGVGIRLENGSQADTAGPETGR